jgi:hypothetical protein
MHSIHEHISRQTSRSLPAHIHVRCVCTSIHACAQYSTVHNLVHVYVCTYLTEYTPVQNIALCILITFVGLLQAKNQGAPSHLISHLNTHTRQIDRMWVQAVLATKFLIFPRKKEKRNNPCAMTQVCAKTHKVAYAIHYHVISGTQTSKIKP